MKLDPVFKELKPMIDPNKANQKLTRSTMEDKQVASTIKVMVSNKTVAKDKLMLRCQNPTAIICPRIFWMTLIER